MYIAEQLFTKSVPSTMKMKVKGGAAVDPDSGNKPKIDVYCFVKVSLIYTVFSNLQFSWVLFQRNGGHCPYCSEEWRNFQRCSWFGGCCQGNKLFLQTASLGKR